MEVPDRLGKYKIESVIGHGSMGAVLKAVQKTLGRTVALKVLPPELVQADPVKGERFASEARFTARLFHPNVPTIYHLGHSRGMSYIAMEYIEGESLDVLGDREFPAAKVVKCFAQIASALSAAHEIGIVHRDLKPGNILIDREGNAHLVDFGIAKGEDSKDLTQYGTILGSPLYMSPEQSRGEALDGRSDIFSLGCTIYRVLTREKPFKAENKRELLLDRMKLHRLPEHRLPTPIAKAAPEVPLPLARIVEKCMHPSRKHRYQTAAELLGDLEDLGVLLGQGDSGKKELSRYRFMVRKNLNFLRLAGPVLAALLVYLAGLILFVVNRARSPEAEVVTPTDATGEGS